jgi:26S proteasome regulatory subunit N1
MVTRSFYHMMAYADINVKRTVPLGLALLAVSNPMNVGVIDALSKMSHDPDGEVATASIISLGLVAGGTNNSRVATSLRSLATYYSKEPGLLFAVRLAQGLTHAGKGLVTFSPYHPDRTVCHPVVLAGIVSLMHILLDFDSLVLGKHHYLLFVLACTIRPRMLVTLDEDLKPLPVSVRVGVAVDTVGQAGRPKTITGFQTHTTPVLLAATATHVTASGASVSAAGARDAPRLTATSTTANITYDFTTTRTSVTSTLDVYEFPATAGLAVASTAICSASKGSSRC